MGLMASLPHFLVDPHGLSVFSVEWGVTGGEYAGGFPHADFEGVHTGAIERGGKLPVQVEANLFDRRVDRLEGRQRIEVLIVKRGEEGAGHLLQMIEWVKCSRGIEGFAADDDFDAIGVAVEPTRRPKPWAERVGSFEFFDDPDLKHRPAPIE